MVTNADTTNLDFSVTYDPMSIDRNVFALNCLEMAESLSDAATVPPPHQKNQQPWWTTMPMDTITPADTIQSLDLFTSNDLITIDGNMFVPNCRPLTLASATNSTKAPKVKSKRPTTSKQAKATRHSRKQRTSNPRRVDPPKKTFISELKDLDVICQRGNLSNNHPGNKNFLKVVVPNFVNAYEACGKYGKEGVTRGQTDARKNKVAQDVVNFVRNTQKGRFVEFDKEAKQWFIVLDKTAREKAKQALRDIRKKAKKAALKEQVNATTPQRRTTITTTTTTTTTTEMNPHHSTKRGDKQLIRDEVGTLDPIAYSQSLLAPFDIDSQKDEYDETYLFLQLIDPGTV